MLSRLSLFATDYTHNDFYITINTIEPINPANGDYVESSWDNAVLIALIVSRSFYNRQFSETSPKEDAAFVTYYDPLQRKKSHIAKTVYPKYVQINESFGLYSEGYSARILAAFRNAANQDFLDSNGEVGAKYFTLLKIKKKKNIKLYFQYYQ